MERLFARWERRFGGFAIPNLMIYVVVGMAGVWLMYLTFAVAVDFALGFHWAT